jgi:nucleotide-binding universal stress UspA family protein
VNYKSTSGRIGLAASELLIKRVCEGRSGIAARNGTSWQRDCRQQDIDSPCRDGARLGGESFDEEKPLPVVLVPVDLTSDSLTAVQMGINFAREMGGRIVLFHAVHLNLMPYGPANLAQLKADLRREAMTFMERLVHFSKTAGVAASCALGEGVAATAIVSAAKQLQAELVVLTSRERSWLGRLFGRGTVERVSQNGEGLMICDLRFKRGRHVRAAREFARVAA